MKALVIAAEPHVQQLLSEALRRRDHEVILAPDLDAACALQRSGACPLVILHGDALGAEDARLCRQLRPTPEGRRCLLLAVGCRGGPECIEKLLLAGADDYLDDPQDSDQLQLRLAVAEQRIAAAATESTFLAEDASAEKQTAAERDSEERFNTFICLSAYGYVESDLEGNILFANQRALDLFGCTAEEVVGKHYREFLDESEWARGAENLRAALARPTAKPHEYKARTKDGRGISVEMNAVPRIRDGHPVGFQCTILDITERKRAVEQLRQSEQRYRLIADNATDMIWTATVEGLQDQLTSRGGDSGPSDASSLLAAWRFTYVSPSSERVVGYRAEEMLDIGLADLLTPDSWARASRVLGEELAAERRGTEDLRRQRVVELEHAAKDGSVLVCEVATTFLRDREDRVTGILGVTRNITKRKRAQDALRKSEARFRGLIENLPDFVMMLDCQGNIRYANRDGRAGTARELIGHSCSEYLAPQYREYYQRAFRQAVQTRQVQAIEALDVFGDWWACRLVPIIEDDELRNVMLICADVSEQKKAAQAIEGERQLLRQLLELHERDRRLVAYEIHDGFAQQLTAAKFNLEASARLRDQDPGQAEKAFEAGIELLRRGVDEARRLISGLRPPVLDELGIVAAVDYLVCEIQERAGPQIEFRHEMQLERLAPPLESALFRIVQESLANCWRHSRSSRVRLQLVQERDRIRLCVQDSGIGFDPESVEEQRFGLRGIRERARLLGGQVVLDTTPGKGTRLEVVLPLVQTAEQGDEPWRP